MNAHPVMVEAAPGVAALAQRVAQRPQRRGLVAAQPHARHAPHQTLQHELVLWKENCRQYDSTLAMQKISDLNNQKI